MCLGRRVSFAYLNQQQIVLLSVLPGATLLSNSPVRISEGKRGGAEKENRKMREKGKIIERGEVRCVEREKTNEVIDVRSTKCTHSHMLLTYARDKHR